MHETESPSEPVVLVGRYDARASLTPELRLEELSALVDAAGGHVVATCWQPIRAGEKPRGATWIGQGKVVEVADLVAEHQARLVVVDNELSPAQIRELEKGVGCRVIDRSELILDIFARRARSREAVLQVELAQLQYTAPRLRGMWTHLERQTNAGAGAMGSRGPGEKQIELDRRVNQRRLSQLRGEIATILARREREVEARSARAYCVGLVGYTNAGKSTLLNALTGADTYVADALFATLDTTSRQWEVEPGVEVVLSDTVGFVRELPHHLVASFQATLAEALHADLLLHVIDASHPQAMSQVEAVGQVLEDLGADPARVLPVLNKVDVAAADILSALRAALPEALTVSALTGEGLDALRAAVAGRAQTSWVRVRVSTPVGDGRTRALAHEKGTVEAEDFDGERWTAIVTLPRALADQLAKRGVALEPATAA